MKRIVTDTRVVGPWICKQLGISWFEGLGTVIGLADEKNNVNAAVFYENYNKASLAAHIAIEGSINREFLWFIFYYPFEQLHVNKIIAPVPASNAPSRRFCEHAGFELEATLKDAHPDGDFLFYTMKKENCRWLSLKRNIVYGQTECTSAA